MARRVVFAVPVINQNRIVTKTCPVCGVSRPLDWFGQEQKLVDYKKDGTVRKVVRYPSITHAGNAALQRESTRFPFLRFVR